ncbi:MAG: hypothetical protein SFT90_06940 [Rickettsiales bacterium]|nr:hypothetical protein [Rickettsiales bacterium]
MAFETSQINPYANNGGIRSISGFNNASQASNKPSLLEQITSEENDDKKSEEKKKASKSERKDSVSLSENALERILNSQIEEKNSSNQQDFSRVTANIEKLTDLSIEFRGRNELAKTRNIPENEIAIQENIRNQISQIIGEEEISDEEIIAIADETIKQFSFEAPALLENLSNNNITGSQFARLDRINTALNKANGFGIDAINNQDVLEIKQVFTNSLDEIGDRKLSEEEVSILTQIQKEISDIEDYKFNIRDSIGPNGVVV